MRRLLFFILFLGVSTVAFGQFNTGRTWSDFYVFDPKIVNPSFAGQNDKQNFFLVGDFDTQPSYPTSVNGYMLSYDSRIARTSSAVGAVIGANRSDFLSNYYESLMYSYKHKISVDAHLGFGVGVNFNQETIDFDALSGGSSYSPFLPSGFSGSMVSENEKGRGNNVDVNLGLSYNFKLLQLGISMQNILASKIIFSNDINDGYNNRQVNVFLQNTFHLGSKLSLQPTVMYALYVPRYYSPQGSVDVGLFLKWKDKVFIGTKLSTHSSFNQDRPLGPIGLYIGGNITDAFQVVTRMHFSSWSQVNQYTSSYIGAMLKYSFKG